MKFIKKMYPNKVLTRLMSTCKKKISIVLNLTQAKITDIKTYILITT
ncbi:MAG: hypothetical protein N4A54_14200 [Peptostreptococcaceae bacterium]|nr:hypothetical protein [Peptostreptococcaceae bacterium]